MSKFGTSKLGGGNFVKRNRYKMKDGDNIYRIVPAMGDLADEGRFSVYYNVVFGFKTSDGKHRPFQSPQVKNNKEKKIDVHCAATDLINKLKGELEAAKKEGGEAGKVKAQQLAKLVGDFPVMGVYSLNNDHYLNVIDRQGNIGVLEMGHKAKLALDNEIKRIRDTDGFDPLAPETGRFFNIRRTGKGLDTMVQVTVVKEKVDMGNGKKGEVDVEHVIDDALADRLLTQKDGKWIYKEAADLTKLYQKPTAAEVELIVSTANVLTGNSTGVDQVLGKGKEASPQEAAATLASASVEDLAEAVSTLPEATVEALTAKLAAHTPAPAAQASVVTEAKAASKAAPAAKTAAENVAAMSPDDFMKQMGINLG